MIFRTRTLQHSDSINSSSLRLRGTQGWGRYMWRRTCGFGRATWRVYVIVVLFPAMIYHLIIRAKNDRPPQKAVELDFKSSPTAGAVHRVHRSSTTAASHASPTSFVCHSQGDDVCVVCVCTQSTPQCSCVICIGWELDQRCLLLVCY